MITFDSLFFPSSYIKESSSENLPTVYSIHGGGFTVGSPGDDDKWNRLFAETHNVLVIALNYSKAPLSPFPAAIYDLEALIIATLADNSLHIDKTRCAVMGFSAGGNLTAAVVQLPGLKAAFKQYGSDGVKAMIPIYPALDRTITRDFKATQRQYKPDLSPKRNKPTDLLLGLGKAFDWSYVPIGQNLRDPLVSPIFAKREDLPAYAFLVACELDLSSHDAWRMASKLAGRPEPSMDVKTGRQECGKTGELELSDERFAWEEKDKGVRWLLIPDVLHGFNLLPRTIQGDETSVKDAEMKTLKVIQEIGDWLKVSAWV
jgi:acetyl esterase/lipase